MATTQYIGARYVPLFYTNPDDNSNNWKSGVAYDPLTVVTDLNQSYTAKIPVPASIGRPSENPIYWIMTGSYSAQVEQYRQEVEDLSETVATTTEALDGRITSNEEDITALETSTATKSPVKASNRKILFVSDSFGTFTNPSFIEYAGGYIGCAFTKIAAPSYGFYADGTYKFQTLISANLPANPETYTDVCIIGGNNDLGVAGNNVAGAIDDCIAYLKTTFPNAAITIMYDCRRINVTPTNDEMTLASTYNTYAALRGCGFLDLRPALHDSSLYTDTIHPNINGMTALARAISSYYTGKDMSVIYNPTLMTYTAISGFTLSGNPVMYGENDTLVIHTDNFNIYSGAGMAKNTWIAIADIGRSFFESKTNYPTRFTRNAIITVGSTEYAGAVSFAVYGGKLYINWNGPVTGNAVNILALPGDQTFSMYCS